MKRRIVWTTVILGCLLPFLAGCGGGGGGGGRDVKGELQSRYNQWDAAVENKNLDGIKDIYSLSYWDGEDDYWDSVSDWSDIFTLIGVVGGRIEMDFKVYDVEHSTGGAIEKATVTVDVLYIIYDDEGNEYTRNKGLNTHTWQLETKGWKLLDVTGRGRTTWSDQIMADLQRLKSEK